MILYKRKNKVIYFKLIILYRIAWYKYELIMKEFSSEVYTLKQIKQIQNKIISTLNERFR